MAVKPAALLALLALGVGAYVLVERTQADGRARLSATQDVPADVRAELDATWGRFTRRFAARRTCFADASVVLVNRVEGGDARYVADGARIEIEIPTTPERFRESLVHELAHHVEATCAEFESLRRDLHVAFGGPERPWTGGDVWEETPSELWAEAVVMLVNGERLLHADEMPIDERVVDRIADWGTATTPAP